MPFQEVPTTGHATPSLGQTMPLRMLTLEIDKSSVRHATLLQRRKTVILTRIDRSASNFWQLDSRALRERAGLRQLVPVAGLVMAILLPVVCAAQVTTEVVSDLPDGTPSNGASQKPFITPDARFVAFRSSATNLVPGDTNGRDDVFLVDREAGTVEVVSLSWSGALGNQDAKWPSVSADGRWVAFSSWASNLVQGDTNGYDDVFVRDRVLDTTERVSIATGGSQGNEASASPSLAANGRFVAFESNASNLVGNDGNGWLDVFVHDRDKGTTDLVSVALGGWAGDAWSDAPSVSADGRFVAFESYASDLVAGDTLGWWDVFVRDRETGTTERVSVSSAEGEGNGDSRAPAISTDGRYVAFSSSASNLVSGDTNGFRDVFLHDRETGTTVRISVATDGTQGNASTAYFPSIAANGRYVAFASPASNLVSGDTNGQSDVFLRDRIAGTTERVSLSTAGVQGDGPSGDYASVSAAGRHVVFQSDATTLVVHDTNGVRDIFLRSMPDFWLKEYRVGATPETSINDVARSRDGGYYFVGSINSADPAMWFRKVGPDGSPIWGTKLNAFTSATDRATAAVAYSEGFEERVAIVGECGVGTQAPRACVVLLNGSTGVALQKVTIGEGVLSTGALDIDAHYDSASGATVFVVAGYAGGAGWVAGLSPTLSIVWQKKLLDQPGPTVFTAVKATPDGGVVLAGHTTRNRGEDALLVKLAQDHTAQWKKAWGEAYADRFEDVVALTDGTYIAVGARSPVADGERPLVMRVFADGSIDWAWTYFSEVVPSLLGDLLAVGSLPTTAVVAGRGWDAELGTGYLLLFELGLGGQTYFGDLWQEDGPQTSVPEGQGVVANAGGPLVVGGSVGLDEAVLLNRPRGSTPSCAYGPAEAEFSPEGSSLVTARVNDPVAASATATSLGAVGMIVGAENVTLCD